MIPAAVSQTETNMEISWASLRREGRSGVSCVISSPDTGAGLQDVQILQNVGECHQPESSQKSQTNPGSETRNLLFDCKINN